MNQYFQNAASVFGVENETEVWDHYRTWRDMEHANSIKRYQEWRNFTGRHDLYPTEFLLPRITRQQPEEFPGFMEDTNRQADIPADSLAGEVADLQARSFRVHPHPEQPAPPGRSACRLQFRSHLVYRAHLITDTVAQILGDRLSGMSVLDLACNQGFFGLDFAYRGAGNVLGLDLREENIRQAAFLARFFNLPHAAFQTGNVYDFQTERQYDVVLNLGLLYHVVDPVGLLQRTHALCGQLAVIDTICHKEPISAYLQFMNKDTALNVAGEHGIVFHPTYRGLIDTLHDVGFRDLIEVVAAPSPAANFDFGWREDVRLQDPPQPNVDLYYNQDRRLILAFK